MNENNDAVNDQLPDRLRPGYAMRNRPRIERHDRRRLKARGDRTAELHTSRTPPRFLVYSF